MYGILLVDKPKGMTSNGVVNAIRRRFKVKVGHAGTLDPLATGVLPLLLGEATKVASHLLHDRKVYETVMVLGKETDTLDAEGKIVKEHPVPSYTQDEIRSVLNEFLGPQEQVPPAYSAIKVSGRRAYDLARSGQEVSLPARMVTVYSLELVAMELPRITLRMEVSGGTYVRSLVRDIGKRLRCGAHVEELRRLSHGPFNVDRATMLDVLLKMDRDELSEVIRPIFAAFPEVPKIVVDRFTAWLLLTGRGASIDDSASRMGTTSGMVILMGEDGSELGLATVGRGGLNPLKIFGKLAEKYVEDRRKENVQ